MVPWRLALGLVLVPVLVTVELLVVLLGAARIGIIDRSAFALRQRDTWHGRPLSRVDHTPTSPDAGFLAFVVVLCVLVVGTVLVVDALLAPG